MTGGVGEFLVFLEGCVILEVKIVEVKINGEGSGSDCAQLFVARRV